MKNDANQGGRRSHLGDFRRGVVTGPGPFDEVVHRTAGTEPSQNDLLAQVIWLMTKSKQHRRWYFSDIENLVMPPIRLGQCIVFRHRKRPIGYLSWAFLDDEAEHAFVYGARESRPADWNSGDSMWWMDFVAPFGDLKKMGRQVRKMFPDTVAHSLRYSEDFLVRRIYLWDRGKKTFQREVRKGG